MVKTPFEEKSVFFCPRCQTPALRQQGTGDYQHICQQSEVLRNEDILVIGAWEDYTGSDTNASNRLRQGTENQLQGTRAGIEGGQTETYTSRGFPTNRFRTRQHIEHIEKKEFLKKETSQSDPEEYFPKD